MTRRGLVVVVVVIGYHVHGSSCRGMRVHVRRLVPLDTTATRIHAFAHATVRQE
jgi:hypothetical protein